MQKSDIEETKAKLDELLTENTRSAVIATYAQNGMITIHPIGAYQDHVLMGDLISHGAMNLLTGATKPKTISLAKR